MKYGLTKPIDCIRHAPVVYTLSLSKYQLIIILSKQKYYLQITFGILSKKIRI